MLRSLRTQSLPCFPHPPPAPSRQVGLTVAIALPAVSLLANLLGGLLPLLAAKVGGWRQVGGCMTWPPLPPAVTQLAGPAPDRPARACPAARPPQHGHNPAVTSAPLMTVCVDVLGLGIYFLTAQWVMGL